MYYVNCIIIIEKDVAIITDKIAGYKASQYIIMFTIRQIILTCRDLVLGKISLITYK